MAKIIKSAQAGTLESSDVLVVIAPADPGSGIQMNLVSATKQQFITHLQKLVSAILLESGIEDAVLHVNDKGAIDCVIEARVKTVVLRATA
jgi:citrate lyase subunit gamma (acyl carrier protein)